MTPAFLDFSEEVMRRRAEDGVRGIGRERSRYRCHIITARFASKPVTEISSQDIREWLREMSNKRALDLRGERRLSRQTINRAESLVSAVFAEAIEQGLIEHNPCAGVKLKRRSDESDTQVKWAWLTLDEQQRLATCEDIPYEDRLAMRFAIATGLRQGEQFSLEIPDLVVDGEHPHVFVRYGSKGLPPKSGKTREVPLFGDGLVAAKEVLEYYRVRRNEENLVFPSVRGLRRQPGKPFGKSDILRGYLQAVGITRRVRWHDLRHTCATNLVTGVLGRRWTLEEIQPLMGHSSIMITQRYSHVGEDALKRAARETVPVFSQVVEVQSALTVVEPAKAEESLLKVPTIRNIATRALSWIRGEREAVS